MVIIFVRKSSLQKELKKIKKLLFKERTNKTKSKQYNFLGFRLFVLGKNEYDVEVFEVKKIDFNKVKKRLEDGKSVFMTTIPEVNLCPK
ncbi:MAG: hypothetical protein P8Y18_08545 [Candidatus Bathyarchaeota archaeon]